MVFKQWEDRSDQELFKIVFDLASHNNLPPQTGLTLTAVPLAKAKVAHSRASRSKSQGFFDTDLQIENIKTGLLGELLVLKHEKTLLKNSGRTDLAEDVVHVSVEISDGAGYDILSFSNDGTRKLIEVKTTRNPDSGAAFFITANEVEVSKENQEEYFIYRVYSLSEDGKTGKYWFQ